MDFTITKAELLRALQLVEPVAERKGSMPILQHALIRARQKGKAGAVISGTDLYLSMTVDAEAEVKAEGSCCVQARTLLDLSKSLPDGEVTLRLSKEGHRLELKAGRGKYHLAALPAADYPTLPNPGSATFSALPAATMVDLLSRVGYAMSEDYTKPFISSTLLEADGRGMLRAVAMDGHRLSRADVRGIEGQALQALLPLRGAQELARFCRAADKDAELKFVAGGGVMFFKLGGGRLSVKLVDEQFPPYERLLSESLACTVRFGRADLIGVLTRMAVLSDQRRSGAVTLRVQPDCLRCTTESPEVGSGDDLIDAAVEVADKKKFEGGDFPTVTFKARYLLDVLEHLDDDHLVLRLGGTLDPGRFELSGSADFASVIMPLRT